jgi:N-acetylglucosaminyl-diphospho-decaprenol L-rhamnosyltransferase
MDTKLATVIVHWNTPRLLAKCLSSLRAPSKNLTMKTVVVDNGSEAGALALLQEQFPEVRTIANDTNVGFARACNQGIIAQESEYVLLLNPDTEVLPGALEQQVAFLDAHPTVAAVGPMLVGSDGALQISCYPMPTLAREAWRLFHLDRLLPRAVYPTETWKRNEPFPVDVIQGACLLLRRSALEAVGGLDDHFFVYTEEVDLCYRLGLDGHEIYYLPQSRVVHHGGQSTKQIASEMFIQLYRSKLQFFRKHHGWLGAAAYRAILAAASIARMTALPFAVLLRPSQRSERATVARNYQRLLLSLPRL